MKRCNWPNRWKQCPACLAGASSVVNHSKWWNERTIKNPSWSTREMPIAKPVVDVSSGSPVGLPGGGSWRVLCPTVVDYMADTAYGDGSSRETATLLVFLEGGCFKVCLSDRDTGRTLWATGDDFDTALGALESRLSTGKAEWRANTRQGKGKRK